MLFPETTMLGALSRYIADDTIKNFQPMGAALGLLPPLPDRIRDKRARYAAICERAITDFTCYAREECVLVVSSQSSEIMKRLD